jgi:hypothetical protein
LNNFYEAGVRALHHTDWPYAYVVPAGQADSATTARLINTLRIGAVDVDQATADFDADGKHYSKGSYIIRLAQSYGSFAKTLLEIQHYPNIPEYPGGPLQRPYDVTAQALPLLFGVNAVPVGKEFDAASSKVDVAKPAPGHFEKSANGNGYLIADTTNSSLYALFALLKDGVQAYRLTGGGAEPGTIYIPRQQDVDARLAAIADKFPIDIHPAASAPTGNALLVRLPRIALYQSWVASMDEGWTRWIFDQNNIPYTRVVDADIRNGDLNQKFDVILIPDNAARAITTGRGGFGEGFGGPQSAPGGDNTGGSQAAPGAEGGRRPRGAQGQQNTGGAPAGSGGEGGRGPKQIPEYAGGLGDQGVANLKAFAEAGGTIVTLTKLSEAFGTKVVFSAGRGIVSGDSSRK